MKKIIFTFLALPFFYNAYSQCTVCSIDLTCDSTPAYPTSCPKNLPNDTAGKPYEATLTFYLPQQFAITTPISATVSFNQINIVGLSGMPPGLTWTAYDHNGNSSSVFYPNSNPPLTERICAKICGTPLVAGYYEINVSAVIAVNVPGVGVQTTTETFIYPITIHPNPTGNAAFTITNQSGCGSLTTTYNPILPSAGNPLYEYVWDFGNGTTSNVENPAPVNYSTPGDYQVSLSTNIYQYKVSSLSAVTACDDDWCGDADELICSLSKPDVYFRVQDNTSIRSSSSITNNKTPNWSTVDWLLEGNQIILSFYDKDGLSADDFLGSTIINITGTGTYSFSCPSPGGCSGIGVSGSLVIGKELVSTLSDTDVVTVFALPNVSNIIPSADTVCSGDTVLLQADPGFISYAWYKDNVVIVGATQDFYSTISAGSYSVEVVDTNGCSNTSNSQIITTISYPVKPLLLLSGGGKILNVDNIQAGISYQWYVDSMPISGATNTTYTPTVPGNYAVVATNFFGCERWSDEIFLNIDTTNSIAENFNESILALYPNPNNGVFTMKLNTMNAFNGLVEIRDITGRLIFTDNLGYVSGELIKEFNVSDYSNGMYLFMLKDENNNQVSKTILIQK